MAVWKIAWILIRNRVHCFQKRTNLAGSAGNGLTAPADFINIALHFKSPFNTVSILLIHSPQKMIFDTVFELMSRLFESSVRSFENSVYPDQLASDEASWSGSTMFFIHMNNEIAPLDWLEIKSTYITVCLHMYQGAQWLSGRVLDSRLRGSGFKPHRHHCVVSLSKTH